MEEHYTRTIRATRTLPGCSADMPEQVRAAQTVRRDKLGPIFGRLDDETMLAVTRSLAVFLGLA